MVYVKWILPSKQTASLYIIIILHQTAAGWYSPSIHAPAGGATLCKGRNIVPLRCFNSRARRGRDHWGTVRQPRRQTFQFTRPQGARHYMETIATDDYKVSIHAPAGGATPDSVVLEAPVCCFNSRARRGRDGPYNDMRDIPSVSIHAPAGGATLCKFGGCEDGRVSIHAPAGGATL